MSKNPSKKKLLPNIVHEICAAYSSTCFKNNTIMANLNLKFYQCNPSLRFVGLYQIFQTFANKKITWLENIQLPMQCFKDLLKICWETSAFENINSPKWLTCMLMLVNYANKKTVSFTKIYSYTFITLQFAWSKKLKKYKWKAMVPY